MTPSRREPVEALRSALLWSAAFAYASGFFLSLTLAFDLLPEDPPAAVGIVSVLRYAKIRDYFGAGLFLTLVPVLTIAFERAGRRLLQREERGMPPAPTILLFTLPFFLGPFFFLTTAKVGWVILLPPTIAYAGTRLLRFWRSRAWLRELFQPELHPLHGSLFAAALGWVIFRYIATGRRIAHVPTLLLEIVFVALFGALFWIVAIFVARTLQLQFGLPARETFARIAGAAGVIAFLPLVAIFDVPTGQPALVTAGALLLAAAIAMRARIDSPARVRAWTIWLLIPLLIYCVSYASTAQLSQWVDLFHRGESLGPASDYLRGKTPYRDVFVLHGLLEDGLLDAWLMEIFGRSHDVSVARSAILGGFLPVALWYLGVAVFHSVPLAIATVAMGSWTTAENNRTFFQVAAVVLFLAALQRGTRVAAAAAGVFGGVALFFSYEIGLYTIAGGVASAVLLELVRLRCGSAGMRPLVALLFFVAGVAAGALPFIVYLTRRGVLDDFAETSFVVIPRIIDDVWSLPFPDIASGFRAQNLNLHVLSEFLLQEKFHLILSFLVIAGAAIYLIQRVVRRQRFEPLHISLLSVTVFAALAQRSALGRAEFRHQYFAAFLTGPLIVILGSLLFSAIRRLWRERDRSVQTAIVLLSAVAIPLVAVIFWIPDLINARLDELVNYQRRIIRVHREPHAEIVRDRISAVSNYLRDNTPHGYPIYDFSNQPAFYFFADRPNPTRFYQVPIASPRQFQAEIIRDLERAKPTFVLRSSPEGFDNFDGVSNAQRAQAVSAYLDDCYQFDRSIRGVEIWTRRYRARPQEMNAYLARIRIPGEKEIGWGRERMVLPLVGSTEGANGALWISDLTLHNGFSEPIRVSLRFAGGDQRIDREVTLAPRRTVVWPDVLRNLFGLDRGLGTIWIVHRPDRAPVAIVKTSDVAHGGRALIEKPLTSADSATANSDRPELTIAGIPPPESRRLNVGIVNTGIVPGVFEITARSREGVTIGRPLMVSAGEDEVVTIGNPEERLGVTLDETTTLRIRAVEGTAVAFATYVDASSGTEMIPAIAVRSGAR